MKVNIVDRLRSELDTRSRTLQREKVICDLLTQLVSVLEQDSKATNTGSKAQSAENLISALETIQSESALHDCLTSTSWARGKNFRLQRREGYSLATLSKAIKAIITKCGPVHANQLTNLIFEVGADKYEFYRAKMSIVGTANYMFRRGELTRLAPGLYAARSCEEVSENRGEQEIQWVAMESTDQSALMPPLAQ